MDRRLESVELPLESLVALGIEWVIFISIMSFFGAERKEPSFERERKKREGEKEREEENQRRVSGFGSRVSQEQK